MGWGRGEGGGIIVSRGGPDTLDTTSRELYGSDRTANEDYGKDRF